MKKFLLSLSLGALLAGTATAAVPQMPEGTTVFRYGTSNNIKLVGPLDGGITSHAGILVKGPEVTGKKIVAFKMEGLKKSNGTPYEERYIYWIDKQMLESNWGAEVMDFYVWPDNDGVIFTETAKHPVVPEQGLYLFVDWDQRSQPDACIPVWDEPGETGSFWGTRSPVNYVDYSSKYGPLAMTVYLMDDDSKVTPNIDLWGAPDKVKVVAGQPWQVGLMMTNNDWHSVYEVVFHSDINGKGRNAKANCETMRFGGSSKGLFAFDPIDEPGTYDVTVRVTKVGRAANTSTNNEVKFQVEVMPFEPFKKPEGTRSVAVVPKGEVNYVAVGIGENHAATLLKDPKLEGLEVIGAKVYGLRQGYNTDLKLWTSSKLGNTADGQVKEVYQLGDSIEGLFDAPVTIGKDGLYVGYSFNSLSTSAYMVPMATAGKPLNAKFYTRPSDSSWKATEGASTIVVYVRGNVNPADFQPAEVFGNTLFAKDQPFVLNVKTVNYGGEPITALEYTYTLGAETRTSTYTPASPLEMSITEHRSLKLPMDGMPLSKPATGKLVINKVNGKDNVNANKELSLSLNFTDFLPVKRPLMEEGTGTGCGWCPRGMLALHEMALRHKDFIAAAYHKYNTTDPMYTELPLPYDGGGYPNASIDRGESIDPFYGSGSDDMGVDNDYITATECATPASIETKTAWSADHKSVTVDADVTFAYVENGRKYHMEYIVTVDNLGDANYASWKQSNYFPGRESDYQGSILLSLCDGTFDLSKFNHVVVQALSAVGSLPSTIEAGATYSHSATLDLSKTDLIDDDNFDDVNVIALVVDDTKAVRNARIAQAGHTSAEWSDVEETVTNTLNGPAVYYNLQGQRVMKPSHGFFIKAQGGVAKKVLIND